MTTSAEMAWRAAEPTGPVGRSRTVHPISAPVRAALVVLAGLSAVLVVLVAVAAAAAVTGAGPFGPDREMPCACSIEPVPAAP